MADITGLTITRRTMEAIDKSFTFCQAAFSFPEPLFEHRKLVVEQTLCKNCAHSEGNTDKQNGTSDDTSRASSSLMLLHT